MASQKKKKYLTFDGHLYTIVRTSPHTLSRHIRPYTLLYSAAPKKKNDDDDDDDDNHYHHNNDNEKASLYIVYIYMYTYV